ncbi:MAG: ribonuclease III [Calditrichaeota bacterium]|nr:ribonuclease III [Calditrichota bacterium]
MAGSRDRRLAALEHALGYRFRDPSLLRRALTHRSHLADTGGLPSDANETLELLGDSVLDLIVIEELIRRRPEASEGEISKLKAMIVSGEALARVASDLTLGQFLYLSQNESRNGGRRRNSILEDTYEAIVAAIYLDSGFRAAACFVERTALRTLDTLIAHGRDSNHKSRLLEFAQGRGFESPRYRVIRESGPDHAKIFVVEVSVADSVLGTGSGPSKKSAEQAAAMEAIVVLERRDKTTIDRMAVEDLVLLNEVEHPG